MSNSLKAKVWSLVVKYRNGNERVERVSHEEFGPFEFAGRNFDPKNGGDVMELRVVDHEIEVPSMYQPSRRAEERAVWQEDRYRVRVMSGDRYLEAISPRMSLQEAAKLACSWETASEGYIDILPPTDEDCQPEEDDDEPEAIAPEQPAEQPKEAEMAGAV